jgi:heme/copper-type cytochrome/quinol oxidase subunit 3
MATATLATHAAPGGRIPGNKGIWVGICCEFVEFLVLFTVYFVARAHFPEAFAEGGERLSRTAGTAITLLMLSSSFPIACSVQAIGASRRLRADGAGRAGAGAARPVRRRIRPLGDALGGYCGISMALTAQTYPG